MSSTTSVLQATRLPVIDSNNAEERARLVAPVHPRDGVWLQDSAQNLMVINSVMTFDRMSVETLREVWMERVMTAGGGRQYRRFALRVVKHKGRAYWQQDPDFRIERHIVEVDDPALSTREGLQDFIGRQASQTLPSDRPLWQLYFVPSFGDGGSALVSRVHHVMGDGMALIPVLFSMMDLDGFNQEPPRTRGTPGQMWLVKLKALLVGGPMLVRKALLKRNNSLVHGSRLDGHKNVAWTTSVDLAAVKAAKNRLGCTVNDILMAVVSGGIRRYGESKGHSIRHFRVSMPVNIRAPTEPHTMDNRFGAVMVDLPVAESSVEGRLREVRARMAKLKRSVEPFVYYGSINFLLRGLPKFLSQALVDFYASKCSAVMSNVPGPQEPLTIAGSKVRSMLFWVPQRADIGLGISILSFSGEVRIGIFADQATIPQPLELVAQIEDEMCKICGPDCLVG